MATFQKIRHDTCQFIWLVQGDEYDEWTAAQYWQHTAMNRYQEVYDVFCNGVSDDDLGGDNSEDWNDHGYNANMNAHLPELVVRHQTFTYTIRAHQFHSGADPMFVMVQSGTGLVRMVSKCTFRGYVYRHTGCRSNRVDLVQLVQTGPRDFKVDISGVEPSISYPNEL